MQPENLGHKVFVGQLLAIGSRTGALVRITSHLYQNVKCFIVTNMPGQRNCRLMVDHFRCGRERFSKLHIATGVCSEARRVSSLDDRYDALSRGSSAG